MSELHVSFPEAIAHPPFDDLSWKPLLDGVTVNVAQVPVVYQAPPEMMQPFLLPEVMTLRYPLPLNGGPVGDDAEELLLDGAVVLDGAVLVGEDPPPPPPLGRYLIPVLSQVDALPSFWAGTKVPDWTEPRTLK